MNIGIDGTDAILNNNTAEGTYSRTLIEALAENYPRSRFYVYTTFIDDNTKAMTLMVRPNVKVKESERRFFKNRWRDVKGMLKRGEKHHLDVFHGAGGQLPSQMDKFHMMAVATIHSLAPLIYPDDFSGKERRQRLKILKRTCRLARHIVACSNDEKADLTQRLDIDPDRISVIYPAFDNRFRTGVSPILLDEVRIRYKLPDKYILVVSTLHEHRNLMLVLQAMTRLNDPDIGLVVVGQATGHFHHQAMRYAAEHHLASRITHIERAHANDMAALYQGATVFAMPTRYDTFGMAMVEAQACGTPVVAADIPVLREVAADGALFVGTDDPDAMADAFETLIQNDAERDRLIALGRRNADRFDTKTFAESMMDLYHRLLNKH